MHLPQQQVMELSYVKDSLFIGLGFAEIQAIGDDIVGNATYSPIIQQDGNIIGTETDAFDARPQIWQARMQGLPKTVDPVCHLLQPNNQANSRFFYIYSREI